MGKTQPEDGLRAGQASGAAAQLGESLAGLGAATVLGNVLAGLAASLLAIVYCLSFSALLFQGPLSPGLSVGLWSLLAGSAITGLYISLTTSLPPVAAGPNNPAVAVLTVLAASVSGAVLASGGDAARAVDHVLLSFTLATLATGALLYALGALQLGQYVRFVPYPVIGGFLAASGWFLAVGGLKVVTGQPISLWNLADAFPREIWLQVLVAVAFASLVHVLKAMTGRMNVLPVAFLGATVLLDLALVASGAAEGGWYLSGTSQPTAWVPVLSLRDASIDWSVFAGALPEIASAAGVTVLALLLDVSTLEVSRMKTANLDREFRINGAANLLSSALGGVMGKLSVNGTRLMDETGGTLRWSGTFAALFIGLVALMQIDLARLVPAPILGGLLLYIGATVLAEVLLRSPAHRAWSDYALALVIMAAIVHAGYLAGVILGFIGACLMFAVSYSRIAVIRRHLTREVYASNVDRSAEAARMLKDNGERIHVFWLAGFIFFGSAHGLFESIRAAMSAPASASRRYAVLDFTDVSGFDTSALISLMKLRNFADSQGVTLAFAGLSERLEDAMRYTRLIGEGERHRIFATRGDALEWCEEQVLVAPEVALERDAGAELAEWLAAELGSSEIANRVIGHLDRGVLETGARLYRQGEAADSIDLVVRGSVAITVAGEPGVALLIRRMSKRTVVGEMGFFRNAPRAADVNAEPGAIVYTLRRPSYERLLAEDPEAGAAFLEFIVRTLSDRLDFANAGIAALS